MNDKAIEMVFTEADDDAHMDGHARMIIGSEPVASPLDPQSAPSETFPHALAGYLTRNGQVGNLPDMRREIENFVRDAGFVKEWTCNCRTGCACIVSSVPHCHYCKKGMETN